MGEGGPRGVISELKRLKTLLAFKIVGTRKFPKMRQYCDAFEKRNNGQSRVTIHLKMFLLVLILLLLLEHQPGEHDGFQGLQGAAPQQQI